MKKLIFLLFIGLKMAFAQSTQVLPDSVVSKKLSADSVIAKHGKFNNAEVSNKVTAKDIEASNKITAPLGVISTVQGTSATFTNITNTTLNSQTLNAANANLTGTITAATGAFTNLNVSNLTFSEINATVANISDTVYTDVLKATTVDATNIKNANTIETQELKLNAVAGHTQVPLFANTNLQLTHEATGFTITLPAADFQPEKITPIEQVGSAFLGQMALFDNGDVQGYGAKYGLVAPVYLSMNNKENIRIKELEFCVLDRNPEMDLWVALYETGLSTPQPTKNTSLKMKAKSVGATGNPNYGCFKANLNTDDFDLDYAKRSYWVKAIPRHNSVTGPDDDYNGEFPEAWPIITTNAAGALKLMHVRIYYDFK